MSATGDLVAAWRGPRRFLRAKLEAGPREDRALAVLMGACLLAFLAQGPGLARAAHLDPSVPFDARIGGALMATVFLLPLLAYGVAALSHLVARALGGRGTGYAARLALFWALFAIAPAMLVQGLVGGLAAPGPLLTFLGAGVLAAFLWLWFSMLVEAER